MGRKSKSEIAMRDAKDAVMELLPKFLEEPRKTKDGGYAPVSDEDLKMLGKLFHAIIEAKFERDVDWDLPLEWTITNRHTHMSPSFVAVPYSHKAGWKRFFRAVSMNLKTAVGMMDLAFTTEPTVDEGGSWKDARP